MSTRTRPGALSLVALTLLIACDEGPTSSGVDLDRMDEDLALVAADAALADLAEMALLPGGGLASAEGPANAIQRTRTVTFFDGEGNEQGGYDPLTTDRIVTVIDISGAFERPAWSASIQRHREMELSGLEGEETTRTWNGSGTEEISRSIHSDGIGTRSYDLSGTLSIDEVVLGVPRAEHPYPLSGSITRTYQVTRTRSDGSSETRERTVTITFDGSQFATLTVNGETFEVDLAARSGDRPVRRRGPRRG